jgi:uncharacterized protein YPO0396
MRKDIQRRHDAHVRVNGVCAEHSPLFDATPGGQKIRAALGTYVANVDRLLAVQTRSVEDRRAATEQCRVARRALRDAATAVVRVGKLVNLNETTMGTMQIPRARTDDGLIAYTRGLLDRVSSHADAFVAEGLPPDLLQKLDTGIRELAAAREARAAARQRFTAATASIRDTQETADTTIDALESIAVNLPAAHPEVLTKLRMAKRVGPRVEASAKAKPAAVLAPSPAFPSVKAA